MRTRGPVLAAPTFGGYSGRAGLRRPVEVGVLGILHVRVERHPAIHEPPMLGAVARQTKDHSLFADGLRQVADQITLRPHLCGTPLRKCRVVHREAVVVLSDGDDEFGARFAEELGPRIGVVGLGLEHGDEVLVAELGLRPVGFEVVLELRAILQVHVAGIPLIAKGRHRVDTPVDEDTEFGVDIPVRYSVLCQRFPRRSVLCHFSPLHLVGLRPLRVCRPVRVSDACRRASSEPC